MPYLNDLLSQYECLLTICSNLSSADIVHLSTTCKENQTYITASEPIKKRLNDVACCDGNGIVAQARLFGYHGGPSLSKPEWECLGGISAPCTECGVKVCDMCRFHCGYFPDGDEKFVFARNGNPDYTIDLDMYEAEAHLVCMASSQSTVMLEHDYDRSLFPAVELRKAWDIFHHRRFLGKCRDCKAQLPDDPVLQTGDGCKCEMWSHFVGLRWLCIPCLLVEETKAYEGVGWRNVVGPLAVQRRVCTCGKPAEIGSPAICKICGKREQWDPHDDLQRDAMRLAQKAVRKGLLAELQAECY